MKGPKCKTCGAEEWGHTCGGATIAGARRNSPPKNAPKSPETIGPPAARPGKPVLPTSAVSVAAGILGEFTKAQKRKEYLKLKARERRAREKASRP